MWWHFLSLCYAKHHILEVEDKTRELQNKTLTVSSGFNTSGFRAVFYHNLGHTVPCRAVRHQALHEPHLE